MRRTLIWTIVATILLVIILKLSAATTNGVFYVDTPLECHIVSQNGAISTNALSAGKTYAISDTSIAEMHVPNKTVFYFSDGPAIEAGAKSIFSVNVFDQETTNLNAAPRKAVFGTHNIALTLNQGEFSIVYKSATNSSFNITTPFVSYQIESGRFLFRITEKSSIVFVIDGSLTMLDGKDKNKNAVKGDLLFAIPYDDPLSGVTDKIMTSTRQLKAEELGKFTSPFLSSSFDHKEVEFVVINKNVIGIWMK